MTLNEHLYDYFIEKTWGLTEDWYASLDKNDPEGIYATTDSRLIEGLKKQNYAFHQQFCTLFKEHDEHLFQEWIEEIAKDEQHLSTPIHYILREFFRTQEQYLNLFEAFVASNEQQYSPEALNEWRRKIIQTFEEVITQFSEQSHDRSMERLRAQQDMIQELSAPIITLGRQTALLPLIGEIDTDRAQFILENTLLQCSQNSTQLLYIDLSGVAIVDTMVGHQLFRLIEALSLIGVKCALSGVRPEVAQTAVQLGMDFSNITVKSRLNLWDSN
ncbi:anti-sigma-factor antagonist [Fictibacillus macauensis ZFHKF-1]|uniref:Anti-sigma-factor antagonist n=1 Tax=Fictibacillus macauensis ZFHKF-1 TaxID=1196324 RepID=I8AFR7_9BACL|nr:STAS domain-containing protein [Fictibacillus macauensis]EIT84224.1 anti-sigma-factor antagonist [Fictibacillus macauensis ZFHKF-1]